MRGLIRVLEFFGFVRIPLFILDWLIERVWLFSLSLLSFVDVPSGFFLFSDGLSEVVYLKEFLD
jgi:hypothetical protein